MSKFRRITNIIFGLIMIAIGVITIIAPEEIYLIDTIIIGALIIIFGLKNLIFYITNARFMVNGGKIAINGLILIDFGVLSFFILIKSTFMAMLYLIIVLILLGAIDVLRSFEIKKNNDKSWIFRFIKGLLIISICVVCIINIKSTELTLLCYGIAWLVSGLSELITAFKESSIIYIQ